MGKCFITIINIFFLWGVNGGHDGNVYPYSQTLATLVKHIGRDCGSSRLRSNVPANHHTFDCEKLRFQGQWCFKRADLKMGTKKNYTIIIIISHGLAWFIIILLTRSHQKYYIY